MDLQFKDRDWQRTLIDWATCLGAGVMAAFAHAPYNWWPLLIISFGLLIMTIDRTVRSTHGWGRARAVFALGWVWGIGYLTASLWWIANALLVDADQFAWAEPLAMFGLPAGLALFYGLATVAALVFWVHAHNHDTEGRHHPFTLWRLVGLAVTISLSDWLRGTIFTGFPWNSIYQTVAGDSHLMQAASLIGPWGLGLLICLGVMLPSAVLDRRLKSRDTALCLTFSLALISGLYLFGVTRLANHPLTDNPGTGVLVKIVQPNIAQKDKWQRHLLGQHLDAMLDLSDPAKQDKADPTATSMTSTTATTPTIVIWPEVAVPYQLVDEPILRRQIGYRIGDGNILMTGAFRRAEKTDPDAQTSYHNAIFVLGSAGDIIGHYDKHHLVPFGEYLPFKSVLAALGLKRLTQGIGSLAAGTGPNAVPLVNNHGTALPLAGPQICYEAIFPGQQVNPDGPRPAWLVNVTNDAWYGDTPGPRQHLAQARFRAVEQGLPMARSANTGISALIDPYGRVIDKLSINTAGTILAPLPAALQPTFYSKIGDLGFWALIVILGLGSWVSARRPG